MNKKYFCLFLISGFYASTTYAQNYNWQLGDIKSQECLKDSTVMSSNIKYCHNCGNVQGNLTSWTFHTTCNGKVQSRLVQSKLKCNTSAGQANETKQKDYHLETARGKLPPNTTACR
ncbi:hypothetical protein [Vibrio sp. MEBiC08052]|uniref:hypothetical protein n=1 Tax=Vibrio sp. MEBiC08052 TaxID=1761910 RepID=UPI000AE6D7D5|nr:hypothetical protein [Vibrio sp. MEBiC08052]